jgi:hypothetical protein
MNRKIRLYAAVTLVALFVAGCSGPCGSLDPITAPRAGGGSASFTTYAAMGTSIGAGYQSGGLVYRHQLQAYPALFAGQVGATFTYPAISDSGIPALLRLVSLGTSPVIVQSSVTGSPTNLLLPTPYTNMSIPGAVLNDVRDTTYYSRSVIFAIIQRGQGSILEQVVRLRPTFISFEYGANEVLGPATSGSGTPILSVAQFGGLLTITLNTLQDSLPDARLALFTVPDVTSIPFVTTIKPYVTLPNGTHVPLLVGEDAAHPEGELNPDDYVLLTASGLLAAGTGIPIALGGNGNPLPGAVVLTAAEATGLQETVDGYNLAIRAEATARGAALVDLYGLLKTAATTGIQVGGARYTSAFLTGGLFSLDGVHPTDLAHGLIANRMIDAVNAKFGASIPHVSLPAVETHTASLVQPAPQGEGAARFPQVEGLQATLHTLFGNR